MKPTAFTKLVLLLASAGGHWPLRLHGGQPPALDVNVAGLLESVESGELEAKLDALDPHPGIARIAQQQLDNLKQGDDCARFTIPVD